MKKDSYSIQEKANVFIGEARHLQEVLGDSLIIDEKLYRIVEVLIEVGELLELGDSTEVYEKFAHIRREVEDDLDSQKVPEYGDVRSL
tara:strand:- start:1533 stop:1796 length:264 start_codon:yes stop_codon:yes gene_type:complete